MRIYGVEIPQIIQDAVIKNMKGQFVARELEGIVIQMGLPKYVNQGRYGHKVYFASRVVDRLLQQERKKGSIRWEKTYWSKP